MRMPDTHRIRQYIDEFGGLASAVLCLFAGL
jgi:hypothetical protein